MKNPALAVTGTGQAACAAESISNRNVRLSAALRQPAPVIPLHVALEADAYFAEYAARLRVVEFIVRGIARARRAAP